MLVIEINDPHDVLPRRHRMLEPFLTRLLLLALLLDAVHFLEIETVHVRQYVRLVDKDAAFVSSQRALLPLPRRQIMAHDT